MKVRVGFAGAGGIASVHLKNLSQNEHVELVAVCDPLEAVAKQVAASYGMAPYTHIQSMLACEQLDALFICVPPFAHGVIEELAIERGIHLFVEKPIGLDLATVSRILQKIQQAAVITSTGYCLRYLDSVRKAKEYLQGKTIAMVRGHYLTRFVETNWWREMEKSGGQLVEQSTHTVDLIRYLAGDVKQVYANMALRVMDDIPRLDIPDVSSVNLVFASGAIGHVDSCFIQTDNRMGLEILGREFRVEMRGTAVTITDKDQVFTYESEEDMYKKQVDAFMEAVRTGNRDLILAPYEEALKTLQVTLAANQSAITGMPEAITNDFYYQELEK